MKTKPKPLILLSGGNTTQPLTERLVKQFDVAILDQAIGQAHASKFGASVIPINTLIDAPMQQHAAVIALQMTAHALSGGIDRSAQTIESQPEWESYRGNGLRGNLEAWLPTYLHASLFRQITLTLAFDKLASEHEIKMAVTHEDVTERFGGMARWTKARHIKTLHVPHGNTYMTREYAPDIHETSICDTIAATPHMEGFFRERGYEGDIVLTGSPNFDRWHGYQKDRAWARECLTLKQDKPVVVYASSWGQHTNAQDDLTRFESAYAAMLEAARGADWQLLVKLHPGDGQGAEQWLGDRAAQAGVDCILTRHYIELVLSAADVIVSVGPSNVLTDAALLDVPSVCINLIGFRIDGIPNIEPNADDARAAISGILTDRSTWDANKEDFIYRNAYLADGRAAERVANYIIEAVK